MERFPTHLPGEIDQCLKKVSEGAAGEHLINGKKVDPKKTKAGHGKILVDGLSQEISDEDIKTYFAQFGNVVEIDMPIDKTKNQRKGFCFVTFDNEQVVHELLKNPKVIGGKEIQVWTAKQALGNSIGDCGNDKVYHILKRGDKEMAKFYRGIPDTHKRNSMVQRKFENMRKSGLGKTTEEQIDIEKRIANIKKIVEKGDNQRKKRKKMSSSQKRAIKKKTL